MFTWLYMLREKDEKSSSLCSDQSTGQTTEGSRGADRAAEQQDGAQPIPETAMGSTDDYNEITEYEVNDSARNCDTVPGPKLGINNKNYLHITSIIDRYLIEKECHCLSIILYSGILMQQVQ